MAPIKITQAYIKKLISDLNKYCFVAGSSKYAKTKGIDKITPEAMEKILQTPNGGAEFLTYVNWSFKEAQKIIIKNRLKIERAIAAGTIEFEAPYNQHYILALLTDYADCIAWAMLKHDISAVRNVLVKPKRHTPLDEQNWQSIQQSLDHFNTDPNKFALATDLTSFFQIGDLYCVDTSNNHHTYIEVKSGEMNEKILDILHHNDTQYFESEMPKIIHNSDNPRKTGKHILRMLRQLERAVKSLKYDGWGSTIRNDHHSSKTVTIQEDNRIEGSWSIKIGQMINKAKQDAIITGLVDTCLLFMYGKTPLTSLEEIYFGHTINSQFELNLTPDETKKLPVFRHHTLLGMPTIHPRSLLYLMSFNIDRQRKLLLGEEFLLVYLHIPALKKLLNDNGFEFTLRNMQQDDQPHADKLLADLFGNNKLPVISKSVNGQKFEWTVLSGAWARIMFDFMPPIELMNYTVSLMKK